uniref:Uncharacterized protein n=1 Tax=Cyprinus carpio carpio TaxID=630221 RepID=A0A9J7WXJ0_CYPCA
SRMRQTCPSHTDTVQSPGRRGATIASGAYWPTLTWFPELVLLATASPWPIPLRKDLLTQRQGTVWHPHRSCLHWPPSSG